MNAHRLLLLLLLPPACTGTIHDPPIPGATAEPVVCDDGLPHAGGSTLRRLTRSQYDHTIRDLFGIEGSTFGSRFVVDSTVGPFRNNRGSPVTLLVAEQADEIARAVATDAAARMPELLPCDPGTHGEDACAAETIATIGRRAYRRPLTAGERGRLLALHRHARTELGEDFAGATRIVLTAMLQSPSFLYLDDQTVPGAGAVRPLTPHALASRLSYFLWDSMPDDALFAAAESGLLDDPDGIAAEVERMLADPRARESFRSLIAQWLDLDRLESASKDATLFPEFDDVLRASMRRETELLAEDVLFGDDPRASRLFTASGTRVNAPLARLYGIEAPGAGDGLGDAEFVPVTLDATRHAGLLTHAGVLAANAHADQTSPVHRGKLVRTRILCHPMPPPPPDVDVSPPAPSPDATTRERFAEHQRNPLCASCHRLMDPIGLGFERFDAIGRYREHENGVEVDETGEIHGTRGGEIDGTFRGPAELAQRLAESEQVERCVELQFFRYALGREPEAEDQCTLDRIHHRFRETGGDLRALIVAIARSDAFRHRRIEEVESCR